LREAIDIGLQRYRANRMSKVVETLLLDSQPVGKILCIGTGRRHAHKPHRIIGLRGDVVHTGDDDFENRATVSAEEVDLIDDNPLHLAYIASGLPASRDTVPFLRCSDDDVGVPDGASVRSIVTRQLYQLQSHRSGQPCPPVFDSLPDQGLHWSNVDD